MRTIQSFLADLGEENPKEGSGGVFSEWLPWCELDLKGDALQFVATCMIGLRGEEEIECVEITASPGVFAVECRGARYGSEANIAGLRAYPKGMPVERGEKLKEIPVDFGGISVVDIARLEPTIGVDSDGKYGRWLDEVLSGRDAALVKLPQWHEIEIPTVESGFGDGCYDVFSLLNEGAAVGLEIVFIPGKDA